MGNRLLTTYNNILKSELSEEIRKNTTRRVLNEGTYTESLIYTNRIISKEFGTKNNRKVPPHMPHMINKELMNKLYV